MLNQSFWIVLNRTDIICLRCVIVLKPWTFVCVETVAICLLSSPLQGRICPSGSCWTSPSGSCWTELTLFVSDPLEYHGAATPSVKSDHNPKVGHNDLLYTLLLRENPLLLPRLDPVVNGPSADLTPDIFVTSSSVLLGGQQYSCFAWSQLICSRKSFSRLSLGVSLSIQVPAESYSSLRPGTLSSERTFNL